MSRGTDLARRITSWLPFKDRLNVSEERLREIGLSLGSSFTILVTTAVTGVILARALGPHERGQLATIVLWPALMIVVGSFGTTEAVTYFVAGKKARLEDVIATVAVVVLAQTLVLVPIGALIFSFVIPSRHLPIWPTYLNLCSIPLGLIGSCALSALNGLGEYRTFQLTRIVGGFVPFVAVSALAIAGDVGIGSAIVCYLSGALLMAVLAIFALLRRAEHGGSADRQVFTGLFAFGLKSYVSSVPAQLNYRLDQLLISIFLQPLQLGIYVVAVTLTSLTALVGSSVHLVVLPAMARAGSTLQRVDIARRSIRWTSIASVAVTLPLVLILPQLIDLLFGSAYAAAATPGRVLLIGAVALSVRSTLDGMLKGVGRPLAVGVSETAGLAVTLVLLPLLLSIMGITGAAIASAVAYWASAIAMTWQLARALDVSFGTMAWAGGIRGRRDPN